MIDSIPKFVQGVFGFTGAGYQSPTTVAGYTVSSDRRAQPIYLRAGNSTDAMISVSLLRDGTVMRIFPVGARAGTHVQLVVVEDISPGSRLDIAVAAPSGADGTLVLDFGLLEI